MSRIRHATIVLLVLLVAPRARAGAQRLSVGTGVAAGALSYPGGRDERAVAGMLRLTLGDWLSASASPSIARVTEPGVTKRRITSSGLTDVPIALELEHALPVAGEPTLGASYTVTLPVGDTTRGLGSGSLGSTIGASVGLSPAPRLALYADVERSLTDFSAHSVIGASDAWGDASVSLDVTRHATLSAGVTGDVGAADPTLGRTLAATGGAAFRVGRVPLSLDVSHGVRGAAPRWSVSLALGTAFAQIDGHRSPTQQTEQTFGGGRHGKSKKGSGGRKKNG